MRIRSCFLHLRMGVYGAVRIRVSCGKGEADEMLFLLGVSNAFSNLLIVSVSISSYLFYSNFFYLSCFHLLSAGRTDCPKHFTALHVSRSSVMNIHTRYLAIAATSLSPLPDRHTIMLWSGCSSSRSYAPVLPHGHSQWRR